MKYTLYQVIATLIAFFIFCGSAALAEKTDFSSLEQVSEYGDPDGNLTASLMPLKKTKPHIVVSIEPLYEVVSSLSHGVVKPEVIYVNFSEINQPLTPRQQEILQSADVIIRVGQGFEPILDRYLSQQGKQLRNKTLTLAKYIPLLDKEKTRSYEQNTIYRDRQERSDLRFWMDPRLVKMLTDIIAPKLVVMDPSHQEEYLDNEIVLRAQLKKVENKMLSLFKKMSLEQKFQVALFNPYLKNRYMSFSDIKLMRDRAIIQPGVSSCIQNESFASIPLNLEYTEKTLNSLLHKLQKCSNLSVVRS